MNPMTFVEFAKTVKGLFPAELNNSDYVRDLLEAIVQYGGEEELDPVLNKNPDTLRGYLQGNSFRRMARKIRDHLDLNKFAMYIEQLPEEAKEPVRAALSDKLSSMNMEDFADSCAELFVEVINAEADCDPKRASSNPEGSNLRLPLDAGIPSDLDTLKEESGGYCIRCGKRLNTDTIVELIPPETDRDGLLRIKNALRNTTEDDADLAIPDGYDAHSIHNKALMDANCATEYRLSFSPEECARMLQKKEENHQRLELVKSMDSLQIDDSLFYLLDSLDCLIDPDAAESLQYKPHTIAEKIYPENFTLRHQVNDQISQYYGFIQQALSDKDGKNGFDFEDLAYTVKKCFRTLKRAGKSQKVIYSMMSNWVSRLTGCEDIIACQIFISFFVQECEVFDEIA